MMKILVSVLFMATIIQFLVIANRIKALEDRIEFVCSLPIVTNKSVLLLQEREGKWIFDNDMKDSIYYVPAGC